MWQLQSFFVEWHYTAIQIETLFLGFSENNGVFLFLGTHIAKAFLYIHLLEIPHCPLQQGSLHHKIHVDCLRRQPLVEKKQQQEKPQTKNHRKLVKERRVVCCLEPAEQINLKHIFINPQWKTKTKITLKQVKFVGIYSLLWLLIVKGLTIAAL